jgi:predicted choloylglycine hydrolase
MKPIVYPVQIVTGGGRAKGFTVEKYLPWSTLPTLKQTNTWNSLLCLYDRLGAAYDNFYQVLGFLSPEMKKVMKELQTSYEDTYRTSLFPEYARVYAPTQSHQDIAEPYGEDDYPRTYAHLLINQLLEGVQID